MKMTHEDQLAALGKNRKRVLERLKKIFPKCDLHPDRDHEWEVGVSLQTAWNRAASWEFDRLLEAKFNYNHWLAPWFQSYIGGVPDPHNIFTWRWVQDQLDNNYENMRTAESARIWAEAIVGIRPMTNRLWLGRGDFDLSKMDSAWLDAECKYYNPPARRM